MKSSNLRLENVDTYYLIFLLMKRRPLPQTCATTSTKQLYVQILEDSDVVVGDTDRAHSCVQVLPWTGRCWLLFGSLASLQPPSPFSETGYEWPYYLIFYDRCLA